MLRRAVVLDEFEAGCYCLRLEPFAFHLTCNLIILMIHFAPLYFILVSYR